MAGSRNISINKYVERKLQPYVLSEMNKAKLNILNDKYEYSLLKEAVDISYKNYILFNKNGSPNVASVNNFVEKIGGIAFNISLPPIKQEFNHLKNICKKKFEYWNNKEADILLKNYVTALKSWGWSDDAIIMDLKDETMDKTIECNTWFQWKSLLNSWTDSIYDQINKAKLEIKENSSISFEKNYTILNQIGAGSFGITYACVEKRLNKKFVIKDFSCERISDLENESFFKKFIEEIDSLFNLHHQNIVSIYDYYIDSKKHRAFYVMEYIDGGNIEEFLTKNPTECNNIFKQAVNAFCYLESKKICHRDIRIDNLLVSNEKQLKIIDFGFIKNIEISNSLNSATKLINYPYPVPKELNNTNPKYDCSTDMYFLGKIFEDLINNFVIEDFKYMDLLDKMISYEKKERPKSFKSILNKLK